MGIILPVTDGENIIHFIRYRSVTIHQSICELLSKSARKSFYSLKTDNSTVKDFRNWTNFASRETF